MTLQMTFQSALKLLNQTEEDLLEQVNHVRERRTQLLGALKFLGMLELLDLPGEEDKKDPARISPETIDYFGQTGSARNPSKLSLETSGRAKTTQGDSIYERALQRAEERAIRRAGEEMDEKAFRSETLFPDNLHEALGYARGAAYQEAHETAYQSAYQAVREGIWAQQESLNTKVRDPSEWLLDQANASCDEILAGSTTLKELLDSLDKLGGVTANQDIINEFLAGLSNFKLITKERSNFNSFEKEQNRHIRMAYHVSNRNMVDDHRSSPRAVADSRSTPEEIRPGTASQVRHIRGPAVPDSLMELKPDFRKTANLSENLERVGADARGKTLNPNEVAKLLIHQGLYKAKTGSLRYRVRQIMRNNPMQYQRIDEDTFLFLGPILDDPY